MHPPSFQHKFRRIGFLLQVRFICLLVISSCRPHSPQNNPISATTTLSETREPATMPITTVSDTPSLTPSPTFYVNTPPTILPSPSPTGVPTTTKPNPSPTPLPLATATAVFVNGVAPETFIYLPAETIQHCKKIFADGVILGRNAKRFSKIGDSIVDTEQFFTVFDSGTYQLGAYDYLESTIDYYSGAYGRFGVALRDGLNSTAVMDPMWANKEDCTANEMPLACEIRLNNPSLLFIHFGTNDWTETYDKNMRQIIEFSMSKGIVPVLITKANRIDQTNERNDILRQLAAEYHIPLWDFDVIAATLPNRGLAEDAAHLTVASDFDYSDAQPLTQGYKAFNLTGLMFLDAFLREVIYNDQ